MAPPESESNRRRRRSSRSSGEEPAGTDPRFRRVRRSRRFGEPAPREPLGRRQWAVLIAASLLVVASGWSLGGMRVWSLWLLWSLALLTFLTAWLPLGDARWRYDVLEGWRRLRRFPPFWLGGAFLLYIIIQALNPAWEYRSEGTQWWLVKVDHIAWLPSGIAAPFAEMNAWRSLMHWSIPWLAVMGLVAGFRSRRPVVLLLWVAVLSATAMALFGIVQKANGGDAVFGIFTSPNHSFFGSFFYGNHAAAFLYLHIGIAWLLIFHHWREAERKLTGSTPIPFLLLCIVAILGATVYSGSRGGLLVAVALMLGCFLIAMGRLIVSVRDNSLSLRSLMVGGGVGLALIGLAGWGISTQVDFTEMESEMRILFRDAKKKSDLQDLRDLSYSLHHRILLNYASLDMLAKAPNGGVGAGGWRYLFPLHQRNYPELWYSYYFNWERKRWIIRQADYAHNDWLQLPIEFGRPGALLLLGSLVGWLAWARRTSGWLLAVGGVTLAGWLVHALVDFVLFSPSVLLAGVLALGGAFLLGIREQRLG